MKNQDNVIHPLQVNIKITQISQLPDKNSKAAITTLLMKIKENMFIMNEKTGNFSW